MYSAGAATWDCLLKISRIETDGNKKPLKKGQANDSRERAKWDDNLQSSFEAVIPSNNGAVERKAFDSDAADRDSVILELSLDDLGVEALVGQGQGQAGRWWVQFGLQYLGLRRLRVL